MTTKVVRHMALQLLVVLLLSPLAFAQEASEATANSAMDTKVARAGEIAAERGHEGSRQRALAEREDPVAGSGMSVLRGLGLCLAVFLIGVALYKRVGKGQGAGGGRRLRIVERLPLTQRTALVMAEVDGARVLLSVGTERVNVLPLDHAGRASEQFPVMLDQICEADVGQSNKASAS